MLSVAVSPSVVYATTPTSASNSIDNLENRGETESIAGITWDQIQEQAQNSPNSLTPIQGLVLWMFAILAFLKLAQKMDSLLQSLGLNVTQTGGRAVGDLIMAGMALKNIGGMMSKGMGMFGFGGGKGGGSGGSASGTSGTGTSSAGGASPAPIPTGGRGSPASSTPTGTNPGATSPRGHTSPSGTSSSTTPTSSTTTTVNSTTPSDSPRNTTTPSSAPTGSTSSTSTSSTDGGTSGTAGTASSRNPIGKAVDWMKADGFAQGAIKAGAKGGLIGVGVYTAKAGASKIGSAVSVARLGDKGIFSAPKSDWVLDKDGIAPSVTNSNRSSDTTTTINDNPEEYQDSKPLNATDGQGTIPLSSNTEEYQDSKPSDITDETNVAYSPVNAEEFHDAGSPDANMDSSPIATTINGEDWHDSEPNSSDTESGIMPLSTDNNAEQWQDTASTNIPTESAPIPTEMDNEGWQNSNSSDTQPTLGEESASKVLPSTLASTAPITSSDTITNGEQWQETKSSDTSKISVQIPTAINNEGWQNSNPTDNQPTTPTDSASKVSSTLPTNAMPIDSSQQEGGENNAVAPKVAQQQEATITQSSGTMTQVGTPIATTSDSELIQQGATVPVQNTDTKQLEGADKTSSVGDVVQQDVSANITSSTETLAISSESVSTEASVATTENISSQAVISSESVSVTQESPSEHEGGIGHGISQDNLGDVNEGETTSSETAPMPMHNPSIFSDFPQNIGTMELSQDTPVNDTTGANISALDSMPHAPIQSDNTAISGNVSATVTAPMPDAINSAQTQSQSVSETIRTELPVTTQVQGATMVESSEPAPLTQTNTTMQSQTTNVNHSKPDVSKPVQPTVQVTTQAVHVEKQGFGEQPATMKGNTSTEPTVKGKSKTPVVKGRKRKR